MMEYDHQVPPVDVWCFDPSIGGACLGCPKGNHKLACIAWNQRMLGYKGPAQPSPTLGDALNAGFGYLEVRCFLLLRSRQ